MAPATAIVIEGGGLGETERWIADTRFLDGVAFMALNVSDKNFARFLAGRITVPQSGKRVLSHLRVLDRLREARNTAIAASFEAVRKELHALTDLTSKTKRAMEVKRGLHSKPEWSMLPEVFSVSVRLAHTDEHPLTVKVLKGRANDAVWAELTKETLTTLRKETDMYRTVVWHCMVNAIFWEYCRTALYCFLHCLVYCTLHYCIYCRRCRCGLQRQRESWKNGFTV